MLYHAVKDDEFGPELPAGVVDTEHPDVEEGRIAGEHYPGRLNKCIERVLVATVQLELTDHERGFEILEYDDEDGQSVHHEVESVPHGVVVVAKLAA